MSRMLDSRGTAKSLRRLKRSSIHTMSGAKSDSNMRRKSISDGFGDLHPHHFKHLPDFSFGIVEVRTETNVVATLPVLPRRTDDVGGSQAFENRLHIGAGA